MSLQPDWQDRLNTLTDADVNAAGTIRLAAEWWTECSAPVASKLVADVRDKCRIILWTFKTNKPELAKLDYFKHVLVGDEIHAFDDDNSDRRCPLRTRREIAAKIIACLSQRTSDPVTQPELAVMTTMQPAATDPQSATNRRKKKPGPKKARHDISNDAEIFELWNNGFLKGDFPTYAECDKTHKLTPGTTKSAVARHKSRERNAQ